MIIFSLILPLFGAVYSQTPFPVSPLQITTTVPTPPRFKWDVATEFDLYLGDKVRLSCDAWHGTQNFTLEWYRNGEQLPDKYIEKHPYLRMIRKSLTLEIQSLEILHHGNWKCVVRNENGQISREFKVNVIDRCGYYANLNVSNSSPPMDCLCIWMYTGNIPRRKFDYSLVTTTSCQPYAESIRAAHQNRSIPSAFLPAPSESHGVPLSAQTPQSNIDADQGIEKLNPVKLFDWITENRNLDISHVLPNLIGPGEMEQYKPFLNGWPKLTYEQKRERARRIVALHRERVAIQQNLVEHDRRSEDSEETEVTNTSSATAEPTSTYEIGKDETPIAIDIEKTAAFEGEDYNGPPKFVRQRHIADVAAPAGRTIKLECEAYGKDLQYVWHKNGAVLMPNSPRNTLYMNGIRGHVLELEDAVPSDTGTYTCEVHNTNGRISRNFVVRVVNRFRSPPIILPNILKDQRVNINGTANFTCEAISDLTPHFEWIKYESDVYFNSTAGTEMFDFKNMENVKKARITHKGNSSSLIIYNVTNGDGGKYACVIGNSLGTELRNATLSVNSYQAFVIPTGSIESDTGYSYSTIIILSIVFVILLMLLLALLITYYFCMRSNKKKIQERVPLMPRRKRVVVTHKSRDTERDGWSDLPSTYQIQIIDQNPSPTRRPRHSSDLTLLSDYEIAEDPEWEIDRSKLRLIDILGEGAFGEVWRGMLRLDPGDDPSGKLMETTELPVAVKKLKTSALERELIDLVSEMHTFKVIGHHDNLLRLIGCCTGAGPLYVILELCRHGNLRDFLRAHRPKDEVSAQQRATITNGTPGDYLEPRRLSSRDERAIIPNLTQRHLVEFAYQVAKGMLFLSNRKIIHRDLAARNILVADNFIMKISDFGLSRDTSARDYYRKKGNGRLPIKWMALEALDSHVYTIESDVWSFGILLWEIMTLGGTPYPTIAMPQLYSCLKEGYRMEAPHNCPQELYQLMTACWQEKREHRPSFQMIVNYLDWMLHPEENPEDMEDTEAENTTKSGSSSDLDGSNPPPAPGSDCEGGGGGFSSRRRARPLSAPVFFPSEPMPHSICDDDDESDIPLPFELSDGHQRADSSLKEHGDECERSPLIQSGPDSSTAPQSLIHPPLLPTGSGVPQASQPGDKTNIRPRSPPVGSSSGSSSSAKNGLIMSQAAPSLVTSIAVDSAISSPINSEYAVPTLGGRFGRASVSNHDYMNVTRSQQKQKTHFDFPPSFPPRKNTRFSDSSTLEVEKSISSDYQSTSEYANNSSAANEPPRRFSVDSHSSSGRGGSSAMSSAEGLGGITEFCRIDELPKSMIPKPIHNVSKAAPSRSRSPLPHADFVIA